MPYTNSERLIDALWSVPQGNDTQLYAILDGARRDGIYPAIASSGCEFECLYRGELDPDLAHVAPYLVKLHRQMPFTDWLFGKGWGDSWGVFMQSAATLRDMRQHLRKFLMVYDAHAKPMYFRYYDPRVLRIYLPTCNAEDLSILFGPIESYLLEHESPDILLRFTNASGVLQRREVPLPSA